MTDWSRWVGRPREEFGAEACYGLVRAVLRTEFGIDWPPLEHCPDDAATRAIVLHHMRPYIPADPVPIGEARAGDVIQLRHGRYPVHLGVMTGPRDFIHLPHHGETVCERIDAPAVRRTVVAVHRPRRPA